MANLIIYDDDTWSRLLPLTLNKPVCELHYGKGTIRDKWEAVINLKASHITQDHLSSLYPVRIEEDNFLVNGSVIPSYSLGRLVVGLRSNEALMDESGEMIAARFPSHQFDLLSSNKPIDELIGLPIKKNLFYKINGLVDLLDRLDPVIHYDASKLDPKVFVNRSSKVDSEKARLFIHERAEVQSAHLDTSTGPIIIDSGVTVMAGSAIKGPCYLGKNSLVKLNTIIYGPFSAGPHSVISGEVKHSIFQAYSNKSHFGYIGDSLIGSHCNLGAGTSVSNLKNTLTRVHLWDYEQQRFRDSGRLKFGMVMGDFTKTAIHTAFNTGTMVGLSCNIYSKGFPRKFIPSFSWGGSSGYIKYDLEKALSVASATKGLNNLEMTEVEKNVLAAVFKMTEKSRSHYK